MSYVIVEAHRRCEERQRRQRRTVLELLTQPVTAPRALFRQPPRDRRESLCRLRQCGVRLSLDARRRSLAWRSRLRLFAQLCRLERAKDPVSRLRERLDLGTEDLEHERVRKAVHRRRLVLCGHERKRSPSAGVVTDAASPHTLRFAHLEEARPHAVQLRETTNVVAEVCLVVSAPVLLRLVPSLDLELHLGDRVPQVAVRLEVGCEE